MAVTAGAKAKPPKASSVSHPKSAQTQSAVASKLVSVAKSSSSQSAAQLAKAGQGSGSVSSQLEDLTERARRLQGKIEGREALLTGAEPPVGRSSQEHLHAHAPRLQAMVEGRESLLHGRGPPLVPGSQDARNTAALELMLAGDPIHARPLQSRAAPSEAGLPAVVNDEAVPSWPSGHSRPQRLPLEASLGTMCSLRISIGAVHLSSRAAGQVRACQGAMLRYAVPACTVRQDTRSQHVAEDTMNASCRDIREQGSMLVFNHTSAHPIRLTSQTLPALTAQPLRLQLMLLDGARPDDYATVLGSVEIPWHEALLTEDHIYRTAAELRSDDRDRRQDGPVGRVDITVSLHSVAVSGAVDASAALAMHAASDVGGSYDICLRVQLGRIRLQVSTLQGVRASLKLGPVQEVSAQPQEHACEAGLYGKEAHGCFSCAAVSSDAVWKVDPNSAKCFWGPMPQRLFFQVWQGPELLGMARVPLAPLEVSVVHGLCAGGRATIFDESIEVRSATTSAPIGSIHVMLHAGVASALQQEHVAASKSEFQMGGAGGYADAADRESWCRMLTAALLRLIAGPKSCEDIVTAAGGDPANPSSMVSAKELQMAVLRHVDGVTQREASAISVEAVDAIDPLVYEVPIVRSWSAVLQDCRVMPAQFACRYLSALCSRVESSLDAVIRELDAASGVILRELQDMGPRAVVHRTGLSNLLRSHGINAQWDLVEGFFLAIESFSDADSDRSRRAEVPARLLAAMLEKRMEVQCREGVSVHQLQMQALTQLQGHGLQVLAEALQSCARADGAIDYTGLTVALEHVLGTAGSRSAAASGQRSAELNIVARRFLQLCSRNSRSNAVSPVCLAEWIMEQEIGVSDTGLRPAPVPSMHESRPRPLPQQIAAPTPFAVAASSAPSAMHMGFAQEQLGVRLPPPPLPPPPVAPSEKLVGTAVQATLQLMLPLSAKAVEEDFHEVFCRGLAEAVSISPSRILVQAQEGSPAVIFEIRPGPVSELRPEDALREFAVQLGKPHSKIPRELTWYVAGATLKWPSSGSPRGSPRGRAAATARTLWPSIVMPLVDGARELLARLFEMISRQEISISDVASHLTDVAQGVSSRRPDLWCLAKDPLTAVEVAHLINEDQLGAVAIATAWEQMLLPSSVEAAVAALWALTRPGLHSSDIAGLPTLSVDAAVLQSSLGAADRASHGPQDIGELQKRFFKVVQESGVDPETAFRMLDHNGDGLISLHDFVAMLQELDLPLSNTDLAQAAQAMAKGRSIDIAEFAFQYRYWLERSSRMSTLSPRYGPRYSSGYEPFSFGGGTFGANVIEFLPPPGYASTCIALPSFVVFAFLDIHHVGHLTEELMACFGEQCLGLSSQSAKEVAHMCDLVGRGVVPYRDFKRYYGYIDMHWCSRQSFAEAEALSVFRSSVRAVLEIVNQPTNAATAKIIRPARLTADTDAEGLLQAGPTTVPDREWKKSCHVIEDTLRRRGRQLDSTPDAEGLAELFSDLRVPPEVAAPLFEWHSVLGELAVLAANVHEDSARRHAVPTYQQFLDSLRRAQSRLRTHLDALFGAVLTAGVSLSDILNPYLRQKPGQMIALSELEEGLKKAGVDLSAVDLEDVLKVHDPNNRRAIFGPELLAGYDAFRKRYGKILATLSDNLTMSGLSADELFARAAHFPVGLPPTGGAQMDRSLRSPRRTSVSNFVAT